MNCLKYMAAASVGLLLLTGCGTELEKAERVSPSGSEFDQSLYQGYVDLSRGEFGEGDYKDSDAFAGRAISVAGGAGLEPEKIDARNLPADKVDELAGARQRLMAALAEGAAERKPLEAAQAQVKFDCWMQEQEENFQPDDIAACRDGFLTEVAKLEEKPVAAAPPQPEPLPGPFAVFFEFNKADLTPDARKTLANVVEDARKSDYASLSVRGYTDLVGSDGYNDVLSEERARAVVNFLIESGLQKEKIVGAAYGKRRPIIPTEQPEVRNRRVEIEFAR